MFYIFNFQEKVRVFISIIILFFSLETYAFLPEGEAPSQQDILPEKQMVPKKGFTDKEIQDPVDQEFERFIALTKADMRFQTFCSGEIVYIYGTSTSGKSTLCDLIRRKQPEIHLLAGRDFRDKYIISLVKRIFPTEYSSICQDVTDVNIVQYLYFGHLVPRQSFNGNLEALATCIKRIRDNVRLIDEQYSSDELLSMLFDEAITLSSKGDRTVIDNLDIDFFLRYLGTRNYNGPLRFVLLYCSPTHLLERVETRNREAELTDKLNLRPALRPLLTYAQLYTRRSPKTTQTLVDRIHVTSLVEIYRRAYDIDRASPLPLWVTAYNDLQHDMWPQLYRDISHNFDINQAEEKPMVEIVPRYPHHILLDTQILSPDQLLEKINLS